MAVGIYCIVDERAPICMYPIIVIVLFINREMSYIQSS